MAPALIAGYFVHEMNHAEMNKTGKSAQADSAPDREKYVTQMVEEEIAGTVPQFEAALESMSPGPGVSLQGSGMEHEADYRRVYIYWHDKAVSEGKSESEAMAQGKAYGAKRTRLFIQPQNPRDLAGSAQTQTRLTPTITGGNGIGLTIPVPDRRSPNAG
jgi:hypothetical protein